MSLLHSFKTVATQTVRLAPMNVVPNTEDLRYMLTTSQQQKKSVILPFKNPNNGVSFIVKVAPSHGEGGPRWTMERAEGTNHICLWTRDTREVAMIQGKLAMDSIISGTSPTPENGQNDGQSSEHSSIIPIHRSSGNFPAVTGYVEPPNIDQHRESTPDWFCSFNHMKKQSSTMPPPLEFDSEALTKVISLLTDTTTRLATFPAFSYFLLRQFGQYQMNNTGFAVIVFDIRLERNGEFEPFPSDLFQIVADRIRPLMSPLDIATHVGNGEFAILLCSSDGANAFRFAKSLHEAITEIPLTEADSDLNETVAVGAAAIPDTCEDPGELYSAAREAKEVARCSSAPYLLYP